MAVSIQCYKCKTYHGDDYLHTTTFARIDGRLRPICNRDCSGTAPEPEEPEKEPDAKPYIKVKEKKEEKLKRKEPEQPLLF